MIHPPIQVEVVLLLPPQATSFSSATCATTLKCTRYRSSLLRPMTFIFQRTRKLERKEGKRVKIELVLKIRPLHNLSG